MSTVRLSRTLLNIVTPTLNASAILSGDKLYVSIVTDAPEELNAVFPASAADRVMPVVKRLVDELMTGRPSDETVVKLGEIIERYAIVAVIGREYWEPTGDTIANVIEKVHYGSVNPGIYEVGFDENRVYLARLPDAYDMLPELVKDADMAPIVAALVAAKGLRSIEEKEDQVVVEIGGDVKVVLPR